MSNVVVVGAQWGDEGKAKVIDWLAERAALVIRCQGGCNAGHTVQWQGETYKFHLIPSGLLYPNTYGLIGSGTVIDPIVLRDEMASLANRGISLERLKISNRAHVTLPWHIALDKAQEQQAADTKKIGTTGKGIGPTYRDKVGRFGLRVCDLFETPDVLSARLSDLLSVQTLTLNALGCDVPTLEALMAFCAEAREIFAPYVVDSAAFIEPFLQKQAVILFEGAQGTLLDVDYGTYPFVTSSNATAGGACTGSGIGPSKIDYVLGVMKAYTTRVGQGPFPTELTDANGKHLQEVGQEVGTTTGRIRRCGWFDAVMGRYSAQVNGLDGLALTKLDVLDGLERVAIATAYIDAQMGERLTTFPASLAQLARCTPEYEWLPGWPEQTTVGATTWGELPVEAQQYLNRLSDLTQTPIALVSVGPGREETLVCHDPITVGRTRLSMANLFESQALEHNTPNRPTPVTSVAR